MESSGLFFYSVVVDEPFFLVLEYLKHLNLIPPKNTTATQYD